VVTALWQQHCGKRRNKRKKKNNNNKNKKTESIMRWVGHVTHVGEKTNI
jgi:hypothetical protein